MMKIGAAASGLAAAAAVTVPEKLPVIWNFLGIPFVAPSMVAALFGCTVTRVIIGQSDKTSRWLVRVPVDLLAIGATFIFIADNSPALLASLASGIFIGTLGATIIKLAEQWGGKFVRVVLPDVAPPSPPSPPPA